MITVAGAVTVAVIFVEPVVLVEHLVTVFVAVLGTFKYDEQYAVTGNCCAAWGHLSLTQHLFEGGLFPLPTRSGERMLAAPAPATIVSSRAFNMICLTGGRRYET